MSEITPASTLFLIGFRTLLVPNAKLCLAQVIDFLEHEISLKGDAEDERKSLLQAGRLNLAMCHLKMSQWIEARGVCDKVKIDGSLVMFCLC